ncbi:MAG: hypothetical protein ABR574_02505 [Cryomorphaceae bacterium]|nr:hypothetical protein [Flavobacteriales bacterium]
MEKLCKECGDKFSARADAKFCSDHCRSSYNNKANGYNDSYVRKVNSILRKNRKVLCALNPDGKTRVKTDDLKMKGFNFNFYTNTYKTKAGKEYRFCYDQGVLDTGDDWCTLVTKYDNI